MITAEVKTGFPDAKAFLDSAGSLNTFTTQGALRSYQRDILTKGSFVCTCPFTGALRQPNAHYVLPGGGVLYHFDVPDPFIIVAASLKDGFPLLCAVTTHSALWIGKHERADLIPLAQELLQKMPDQAVDQTLTPHISVGDPNFAHFLWNEFPALFEAIRHTRDFRVNLRFDPLGIMQGFARETGLTVSQMTRPSEGKGWSKHPTVCVGSTSCNTLAKTAVMTLMNLPDRKITPHRIWVSVRDKGRTMENQTAFLSALIAAVSARAPQAEFLIDGFSTPMDIERPIYDILRPKFAARIQGAQKIVAQLITDHPRAPITDMTGQSLNAALRAISTCDFYVSHAGTMQHKPAWFYPLRGLQHGNRASLSPAALRWSAQMIAATHAPFGLSADVVTDTTFSGPSVQNDRNKDYIVTDIPAAVRHVMNQLNVNNSKPLAG